jgi:nickel transport protein
MKRIFRFGAAAATMVAGSAILVAQADAHGIWFAQRAKQIAIIYGIGADDLEAVKRQPNMEQVLAFDADYQPIPAKLRTAGSLVLVDTDAPPTLVSAVLQNGTWSWLPDGEIVKKSKDEVPNATKTETTIKYAVSIQAPLTKPMPLIPTQALQIVPVGKIPEKLGQPLTYRVTWMGKPAAGAAVINDMVNDPDAVEVKTKADGTVTFPVRNQGLNVIRAVHVTPGPNPAKSDRVEHTATLAFTLAHKPE